MKYSEDSLLHHQSKRLEESYKRLQTLRRINGGYLASPNPGLPNGVGRYNVFWLRDIMYATYANEYLGNMEEMIESYELVMTIMMKYKHKICAAIKKRPHQWALHARFHPNTLEELTPEWGHHQLDVFGLFLYKTGDLIKKGHNVVRTSEQRDLIKDIIQYLFTYRWETHPDYGMWEEGPEVHSSSIGAVFAGLTMWYDDGYYNYKYPNKIELSSIVSVSERHFDTGRKALQDLLPRESWTRACDMAQLSLIWPYNIVNETMRDVILANVEGKLLRERGVIRYEGDLYFNANPRSAKGNEAQWPLGIAWLAIVHNKMARWSEDLPYSLKHLRISKKYLLTLDRLMVNGALPELYSGGKPNDNCPLAWAHSFHIIALQSFIHAVEIVRMKHGLEITEDLDAIPSA